MTLQEYLDQTQRFHDEDEEASERYRDRLEQGEQLGRDLDDPFLVEMLDLFSRIAEAYPDPRARKSGEFIPIAVKTIVQTAKYRWIDAEEAARQSAGAIGDDHRAGGIARELDRLIQDYGPDPVRGLLTDLLRKVP